MKQEIEKAINWWKFQSEDEQIFLMMKYGYNNPFDPQRVKQDEILKIYQNEKK